MNRINWKRYGLYLLRWQLSTPILAGVLFALSRADRVTATVVANFLGGLIFFWVDMFIFTSRHLSVEWEVRDRVVCTDCGREARGYRIIRAKRYDRTADAHPEFRCEECSRMKTEELRLRGIAI
jgi:hypothetical protein